MFPQNFLEARRIYESCETWQEPRRRPHPEVVGPIENAANSYQKLGRVEEALKLHLDTLPTVEKLYGEQHERVAQGWYNIAVCYDELHRREEALGAYSKASVAYEQVYGPGCSAVAYIQHQIAMVYTELGRLDEAMHLLRKALRTQAMHASSREAGTLPSGCSGSNPADEFGSLLLELDIRLRIQFVQQEAHRARSVGRFQ